MTLRFLFISCVALLLSACHSTRYMEDYRDGVSFSSLKTYQLRSVDSLIAGFSDEQLSTLVHTQLNQQGFTPVAESPDMIIDAQVFAQQVTSAGPNIGIGIGLPIGRHGGIGLGTSQPLGGTRELGVIVVDITERTSNQLVWRGHADKLALSLFTLREEPELAARFQQLLSKFPPQPK